MSGFRLKHDNVFEIEFRDVSFKYANSETYACVMLIRKSRLEQKLP
nr:hypothetical protein [uncultured Treponema sp.]